MWLLSDRSEESDLNVFLGWLDDWDFWIILDFWIFEEKNKNYNRYSSAVHSNSFSPPFTI